MERPRGERAAARGEGGEGGGEDPPPRQLRRPRAGVRAAPRRARVVVLERDAARPNLRPDVRARPPPERARHGARLRRAPPRGPLRGSRHHRPRGEERRRGALGVHRGRRPGRPVRGDLDPSRRGRPLGNLAGGPSRPRRGPIARARPVRRSPRRHRRGRAVRAPHRDRRRIRRPRRGGARARPRLAQGPRGRAIRRLGFLRRLRDVPVPRRRSPRSPRSPRRRRGGLPRRARRAKAPPRAEQEPHAHPRESDREGEGEGEGEGDDCRRGDPPFALRRGKSPSRRA